MQGRDDPLGLAEIGARSPQAVREEDQRLEVRGRLSALAQPRLGSRTLQRREAEPAAPIERQQAMDQVLAQAALAVEEQDWAGMKGIGGFQNL